jgi:lysine 6-dehydrogenase
VFSPADVIEEYIRPARYIECGEQIVKPALSDIELVDFPGLGTLEAFNTDGLRSLIHTLALPNMKEKTMRYPGHAQLMRVFRESGFFSDQELSIKDANLKPLDLTSRLMFDQWRLKEGEEDFTAMLVELRGEKGGWPVKYTYHLLDRYDHATETHSMARTTGYTATIIARQVLNGLFERPGVNPPEYLGEVEACYQDLLNGYAQRGIELKETIEKIKS